MLSTIVRAVAISAATERPKSRSRFGRSVLASIARNAIAFFVFVFTNKVGLWISGWMLDVGRGWCGVWCIVLWDEWPTEQQECELEPRRMTGKCTCHAGRSLKIAATKSKFLHAHSFVVAWAHNFFVPVASSLLINNPHYRHNRGYMLYWTPNGMHMHTWYEARVKEIITIADQTSRQPVLIHIQTYGTTGIVWANLTVIERIKDKGRATETTESPSYFRGGSERIIRVFHVFWWEQSLTIW